MSNPFVRKLETFAPLSAGHRQEIEHLTARVMPFGSHEDIIGPGDEPQSVHVVMDGWACRYRVLPDRRRQIVSLFLPGDMCDPYVFLLGAVDHAIGALTPCTIAKVPVQSIRELTASEPQLAEALWWQALVGLEIQREWSISLGRRTAVERIAHLFCEVLARLTAVGRSNGVDCGWPLTQADLADITGLSTIHVNRSLQQMRAGGLIELRSRRLMVRDHEGLMQLAMFDPTYLHRRATETVPTPMPRRA